MPFSSLRTAPVPPARRIRPMIDSRTPSRSLGTSSSEKPVPRSRMKTSTPDALPSMYTEISPPACRAALRMASLAAAASSPLARSADSPADTTSMRTG